MAKTKTVAPKVNKEAEALKALIREFTWNISGQDVRSPTGVKLSPEQLALLQSVIG